MAYVTIPEAVFLILKRIGEVPLQQVKSVTTAGQPTGAKAGLFATIVSVAGGVYNDIPGVSEAVGAVTGPMTDFIKEATNNISSSLSDLMGPSVGGFDLTINPAAGIISGANESISSALPAVESAALQFPELDFTPLTTSLNEATPILTGMGEHTDLLAGITAVPPLGLDYINNNSITAMLSQQTDVVGDITAKFIEAGTALGKVGASLTEYVNDGIKAAHESLLSVTNGKMGLVTDPNNIFGSLSGAHITSCKGAIDAGLKLVQDNPALTQAGINAAAAKIDTAAQAMQTQITTEIATVTDYHKATACFDSLGQTAQSLANPATAAFTSLIANPTKLPLLKQVNAAVEAVKPPTGG